MSDEVLAATVHRLLDERLVGDELAISWHGAEPLVAGLPWFEHAIDLIDSILGGRVAVQHVFQTNGVLIDDRWCRFFDEIGAQVGVSIDGQPDQNLSRVNWAGRPSFDAAIRGARRLRTNGLPWTLLTVATHRTMSDPAAFIDFVRDSGCSTLGFKVEETNVGHESDLRGRTDVVALYTEFVTQLWRAFPPDGAIRVREFDAYRQDGLSAVRRQALPVTLVPLRNLTVAVNGDFTVFSGELLFREDDQFVFGNVLDGPLLASLTTEKFGRVSSEILRGVRRCAEGCPFYRQCGSFYISQKFAEHQTFDADETLACLLETKTLHAALDRETAKV